MLTKSEKDGISFGLLGGLLWALDTVLMGLVMLKSPLKEYAAFSPLIATFLHDSFSSIWLLAYNLYTDKWKELKTIFKNKSSLVVAIAAIFGGPIGMTGYILSIKYIGASNTAIISAMYPAVGSFFGYVFLKEKLGKKGILGLVLAISATMLLGLTAKETAENLILGFSFALLCVLGWGCESVISAYGMKQDILPDVALQIRQIVSATIYGVIIIPLVSGYSVVSEIITSPLIVTIAITALAGTSSYLFYYRSINKIGAIKAMGLNISYSAWAIVIGLFFGNEITIQMLILSIMIIIGSILTTENPKEFFSMFLKK